MVKNQFECSICQWINSFWFGRTYKSKIVWLLDTLEIQFSCTIVGIPNRLWVWYYIFQGYWNPIEFFFLGFKTQYNFILTFFYMVVPFCRPTFELFGVGLFNFSSFLDQHRQIIAQFVTIFNSFGGSFKVPGFPKGIRTGHKILLTVMWHSPAGNSSLQKMSNFIDKRIISKKKISPWVKYAMFTHCSKMMIWKKGCDFLGFSGQFYKISEHQFSEN